MVEEGIDIDRFEEIHFYCNPKTIKAETYILILVVQLKVPRS